MCQTDSCIRRLGCKCAKVSQEMPVLIDEPVEEKEETVEPISGQMYFSFDDNGDVSYHVVDEKK